MKTATDLNDVGVFWDYENCPVPANSSACSIAKNICSFTLPFGRVKAFKAYLEISEHSSVLRSELQSSGVTLVDCPHNGKKEVADKTLLVDIMAYAIDNPVGSTIVLITGDRDFAYALSTLSLRRYQVVLIAGSNARPSLTMQADIRYDWVDDIVRLSGVPSLQPAQKFRQPPTLQGARSEASLSRNSCSCIPVMDSVNMGSTRESAVDTAQSRNRTQRPLVSSQFHAAPSTQQVYRQEREIIPTSTTNANVAAPLLPPTGHRGSSSVSVIYQEKTPRVVNPPVPGSQISPSDPHPSLVKTAGSICSPPLGNDRLTTQLMQPVSSAEPFKDNQVEKQTDTSKPTTADPNRLEATPIVTQPATKTLGSDVPMDPKPNLLQVPSVVPHVSPAENRCEGKTDVCVSILHSPVSTLPTVTSGPSTVDLKIISPSPLKLATSTVSVHRKDDEAKTLPEPAANTLVPPPKFSALIELLQFHKSKGRIRPLRSIVASQIAKETYQSAGVSRFSQYMAAAHAAGIIELGGRSGQDWVGLQPKWLDAVVAPPQYHS